jgi:pimeloyl-ACP methyl ester carboxylesterase
MNDRHDSTPSLSQIKCPALIIHGEDDQLIPVHEAQVMYQFIPNSKLILIPDAGHLPNIEQPHQFNQAVREFIKSVV